MSELTTYQRRLLASLQGQAEAAAQNPLMYEPGLLVGTEHARTPTADVLLRRGLVDQTVSPAGVRIIAINAAGRAALNV